MRLLKRSISFLGSVVLWLALAGLSAFGAFGVYFCAPLTEAMRTFLCAAILILAILPLVVVRRWSKRLVFVLPVLAAVYGWYFTIQPKMDAPWMKDVAVLPDAEVSGDTLVVRNIRHFAYRTDTDFDVRYYDKTFDLRQLKSVDLFLSYWGPTAIAHTIISFGFEGGDQLAISIETRKEVGESYSALQGFFRKFELFYVVGDERDLIGLRVNHRNEQVYLYRMRGTPSEARRMLVDYMETVNGLKRRPRFYHAVVTNCTTSIVKHILTVRKPQYSWALLANGYLDRWRYELGVWGFELPFEEFRRRSNINEKVRRAADSPEFSRLIREGVPSIAALERRPNADE